MFALVTVIAGQNEGIDPKRLISVFGSLHRHFRLTIIESRLFPNRQTARHQQSLTRERRC